MEFENIYFKVNHITERLSTEYRHEDEYSHFYRAIKLDIFGRAKSDDAAYHQLKEHQLGFIEGTFLHMNRMSRELGEEDIWAIFDHIGGGADDLGDIIFQSEQTYSNIVGRNQNIFWLKALYVYGPYQGKGVGRRVVSDLEASLLWLFDYSVGSFIVSPSHYAEEMGRELWTSKGELFSQNASKQASLFFQRLGFRPIADGLDYMYLNTDFDMMDEETYPEDYYVEY